MLLMGKKSRLLMSLALVATLITGCSSTKPKVPDEPPEVLYQKARLKLDTGNYLNAIELLEALDSRYPFGAYSNQVQLDLIYAYYKQDDTAQAIANIDRFIRLNPAHKNIDYVFYMRGLTNMALDDSALQGFFGVDRSDRDPQHARDAFNDFSKLVRGYPNSQYATDAYKRMVFLKDRLAKYELSVVDYYTDRGAWVAVVNRVEGMMRNYPDTQATRDALPKMENAYRQMQMNAQADKVAKIIAANSKNT